MKIFGIGMMKTGTSTLGFCLTELGYHHAPYSPKLLHQIKHDDYSRLPDHIASYDSFDDHPWPSIYPWLDQTYPDSKFILTVRQNSETWYKSICQHAKRRGPTVERKLVYGYAMPQRDKAAHIAQYNAHINAVQTYFQERPDKLLVLCWEKGDGWPELCNFLGHERLDKPLPHANASHGRQINGRRWLRNLTKYTLFHALGATAYGRLGS